jgi:hypothetical protein
MLALECDCERREAAETLDTALMPRDGGDGGIDSDRDSPELPECDCDGEEAA